MMDGLSAVCRGLMNGGICLLCLSAQMSELGRETAWLVFRILFACPQSQNCRKVTDRLKQSLEGVVGGAYLPATALKNGWQIWLWLMKLAKNL